MKPIEIDDFALYVPDLISFVKWSDDGRYGRKY
jgi:hypothetical protein